jgi:hypothetical protein
MVGCRNSKNKEESDTPLEKNVYGINCFSKSDREQIITSIFTSKDADLNLIRKNQLFPDRYDGKIFGKLLSSEFITMDLTLEFSDTPMIIVDSLNLTEDTYRIKIDAYSCSEKKISFTVTCPFEGQWHTSGEVSYEDGNWSTKITSGGIAD